MVQEYYRNVVTGSQMLYFHKPDKDLKMNFKMDPYDKDMDKKIRDIRLVDAEPAIKILDNGDVRFRYYAPNA
ncbi:MAG: hypothetical protein IJ091_01555, partial [Oscillospiraceae bacterium]|nr:hypothetical protein [Oscillospiraceae bacterium]